MDKQVSDYSVLVEKERVKLEVLLKQLISIRNSLVDMECLTKEWFEQRQEEYAQLREKVGFDTLRETNNNLDAVWLGSLIKCCEEAKSISKLLNESAFSQFYSSCF